MQEILRVERAVKYFGSGSAVTRALAGVSFSVEKGEFVAVMGASGSGKSTLLNVIAAIEPLSGGRRRRRGGLPRAYAREGAGALPPRPPRVYLSRI